MSEQNKNPAQEQEIKDPYQEDFSEQSFLQKFILPKTKMEWLVLTLFVTNVITLVLFLFFAYTKWRY